MALADNAGESGSLLGNEALGDTLLGTPTVLIVTGLETNVEDPFSMTSLMALTNRSNFWSDSRFCCISISISAG